MRRPCWQGPYTRPAVRNRSKTFLTRQIITRHFKGGGPEDVIGTHTTSEANTSIFGAVEVDYTAKTARTRKSTGKPPSAGTAN